MEEEDNPGNEDEPNEELPTLGPWESWKAELEPWLCYGVFLIVVIYIRILIGL